MRFIYLYLFGYQKMTFKCGEDAAVANALLKLGISAKIKKNSFIFSLSDAKKMSALPIMSCIEASEKLGLIPFLIKTSKMYLTVFALIITIIVNILLSGTVFDVRISGNSQIPDYKIRTALESAGLSVGKRFSRLDTSKIELTLLDTVDGIAWVNINRRGTVCYVEVVERKGAEVILDDKTLPSNIVAAFDCVIEEITVKSGKAEVKVGDVVRKGDILISGVLENETSTTFVRAEGKVIGSVMGEVKGKADRNEKIKCGYETECCELRLNILNFSANIFKMYGNSAPECDIIIDNEYLCLKNGKRIPLGYTRVLAVMEKLLDVTYSDSELIEKAYERHAAALNKVIASAELMSIKTVGSMDGNSYVVTSTIRYLADAAEERWIELSGD